MMVLVIPKSVGGNDDFFVDSAKPVTPIETRAKSLIIPATVGGGPTPNQERIQRERITGGEQQLPARSQFQQVPKAQPADGSLASFGAGIKRGLENVGEGIAQRGAQALGQIGIDTDDFLRDLEISRNIQKQQFQPTQEQSPIASTSGEIVGEVIGLPIPASSLRGAAVAGGAIGALRFGEKGGSKELAKNILTDAAFGLAGQFAADKVVGLVKSGAKRLGVGKVPDNIFNTDGTLNSKADDFFRKEGIDINDLSESVLSDVRAQPRGADIEQSLRTAQAKELGVQDLTKADVSQEFTDQSAEFALSRQRGTAEADTLRQVKAAQNQQITEAANTIVSETAGEADKLRAGTAIQDAMRGDKSRRRAVISELYAAAEKEAGVNIPVEQESIANSFLDQDFLFGLDPDVGGQLRAVKKQLESFSVFPPELLKTADDLRRIRPLDIGSANDLRKNVRALISETSPKSQRALSPIIDSIDEAVDSIAILDELGDSAKVAFEQARQSRVAFGKDFEAKDVVQNIVDFKPGTQTDKIPPSVVFDKIMSGRGRLENTKSIRAALLKAGEEGAQAWNDFRAVAASEIVGKALKTGKTATGDLKFSGANYNKALKDIGDDTLKIIFNPAEFAKLKQLGRVSRDLTILQDGVFTPSGAQVENKLSQLARSPLFRLSPVTQIVVNEGAEQISKGARRRELTQVLNPSIDVNAAEALGSMSNASINALRLMGLSASRKITQEDNKENK